MSRPKVALDPPVKLCALDGCDVVFGPRALESPGQWAVHRYCGVACANRAPRPVHQGPADTKVCACPCGRTLVRDHRRMSAATWARRKYYARTCVGPGQAGRLNVRTGAPRKVKPAAVGPVLAVVSAPRSKPWRPAAYGWDPDGPTSAVRGPRATLSA